jgi:hypothetical protein
MSSSRSSSIMHLLHHLHPRPCCTDGGGLADASPTESTSQQVNKSTSQQFESSQANGVGVEVKYTIRLPEGAAVLMERKRNPNSLPGLSTTHLLVLLLLAAGLGTRGLAVRVRLVLEAAEEGGAELGCAAGACVSAKAREMEAWVKAHRRGYSPTT